MISAPEYWTQSLVILEQLRLTMEQRSRALQHERIEQSVLPRKSRLEQSLWEQQEKTVDYEKVVAKMLGQLEAMVRDHLEPE